MQKINHLKNLSIIAITGLDAKKFLQGQLTCDVENLQAKKFGLMSCCDTKGRIIFNGFIYPYENGFWLIVPNLILENVLQHFKKYRVFSKVDIRLQEEWKLFEIPSILATADTIAFEFPHKAPRFFILSKDDPNLQNVDIVSDEQAWKNKNITDGLVFIYPKTSGEFLPQMLNFEKLGGVSFTKGCYIGQEIIARTQYLGHVKRKLCSVNLEENKNPGDLIYHENAAIGMIVETSCNSSNVLAVVHVTHTNLPFIFEFQ